MQDSAVSRRQFLEMTAGVSLLASLPAYAGTEEVKAEVPSRTLGNTGETVSAVGLGGFHLGKPALSESDAIRIIRTAIDKGSIFSITAGTTTAARVKFACAKRFAMVTVKKSS